jgi:hypothetical protein
VNQLLTNLKKEDSFKKWKTIRLDLLSFFFSFWIFDLLTNKKISIVFGRGK